MYFNHIYIFNQSNSTCNTSNSDHQWNYLKVTSARKHPLYIKEGFRRSCLFIFSFSWRFMSLGIFLGVIMLPIQLRIASGDRNCRAITPPTGMGAIIHMTVAMHVWWMVMTTDIYILTHVERRFKFLQFFIFNNAITCIAVFNKTCELQISPDKQSQKIIPQACSW